VPDRHGQGGSPQAACRFRPQGEGRNPTPARALTAKAVSLQEGKRSMGGFGFIAWIIIGIVAGWLAEKIMKRDHGLLTNLIVGVVGALIGGFLANNLLGVDAAGNWIVGIIVATIGAVVLLFLLGLVKRRT
jgi:uncharacterized membrane protein YeaQ/YmgE (transglycosylase-associated protein family)